MKNLKKLILFISLFCLAQGFAQVKTMSVSLRAEKKLAEQEVELKDLIASDRFHGRYFKICKADSDAAIRFDDPDEALVIRAATVYYHLTIAREYFEAKKHLGVFTPHEETITVRVEQVKGYSPTIHFKENLAPVYNTAYTIGPSNEFSNPDVPAWGPEIWFYKAKKVKRKRASEKVAEQLNSWWFKSTLMQAFLAQDAAFAAQDFVRLGYVDELFLKQHGTSVALSIGLSIVTPFIIEKVTKLITPSKFYLDTAMIPEAIYHEYSHIALSKQLGYIKPSAIVEGYPNYYASKISGKSKVVHKAGEHSKGVAAKNGEAKDRYSFDEDYNPNHAHGSFMFSLLRDLEDALGDEGELILAHTLHYLSHKSRIRGDFEKALMKAIGDVASDKQKSRLAVQSILVKRGL